MSLVKSKQSIADHGEVFTPMVESMPDLVKGETGQIDSGKRPITFPEWGCLGDDKFQRRDIRFDVLTHSSAFSAEGSLFTHLGKHEILTPVREWPSMGVAELVGMRGHP